MEITCACYHSCINMCLHVDPVCTVLIIDIQHFVTSWLVFLGMVKKRNMIMDCSVQIFTCWRYLIQIGSQSKCLSSMLDSNSKGSSKLMLAAFSQAMLELKVRTMAFYKDQWYRDILHVHSSCIVFFFIPIE